MYILSISSRVFQLVFSIYYYYLFAKIDVDTAENERLKVWGYRVWGIDPPLLKGQPRPTKYRSGDAGESLVGSRAALFRTLGFSRPFVQSEHVGPLARAASPGSSKTTCLRFFGSDLSNACEKKRVQRRTKNKQY